MESLPSITATLELIPTKLRHFREHQNVSLTRLSALTGISTSTLSRLEHGQRKPSLELLLPISAALCVSLDELIAPPRIVDPRVRSTPERTAGRTFIRLTHHPHNPQAYKVTIPALHEPRTLRSHDGYEWMYVLSGRLRLLLGDKDFVLKPGEAAEFDTAVPHWFGAVGKHPVELLTMFSSQGERLHLRTSLGNSPSS
ncbi:HTH-type transcriptional regulator PuuR [Dermatophilus congolensis]|uniref:HTH-type transcriptional regulator PuuR n=1 Tax=Dermatophilus congolensis TaxID=1863 RepID=A0A239VEQ6_9MICO|nr:XRE family transcriptional regulator [Dermatophilus congolensis]SNV20617.1 HTH-type transcriptional regulator PuuR [Dermatophilus congolensis]